MRVEATVTHRQLWFNPLFGDCSGQAVSGPVMFSLSYTACWSHADTSCSGCGINCLALSPNDVRAAPEERAAVSAVRHLILLPYDRWSPLFVI